VSGGSHDLLRMLEPAVRPGNLQPAARGSRLPIEQQSFEALLREADDATRASDEAQAPQDHGHANATRRPSPLDGLSRIENASLQAMLGERAVSRPADAAEPQTPEGTDR
jgi:hypothetical protein